MSHKVSKVYQGKLMMDNTFYFHFCFLSKMRTAFFDSVQIS